MPELASPTALILESLGYAVFARDDSGALRLVGSAPAWLVRLWPAASAELRAAEVSPFLENFLVDAAKCWSGASGRRVRSGPWIEETAGGPVELEATALNAGGHSLLLVQRLGEEFEIKKAGLQKARETAIALQRLNSEIQKKEILLHCLAEDLSASLSNVITTLQLIELERNSPRTGELLGLALRGTQEQRSLIGRVLAVFENDLSGLYGRLGAGEAGADLDTTIRDAVGATEHLFAEKDARFSVSAPGAEPIALACVPAHFVRIVANLLENALLNIAPGGAIAVSFDVEPEAVVLRVQDNGATMPADVCDKLVSKFEPAVAPSHEAFLRLRHCRIAAEGCRGEIGYTPQPAGGNCFWVRVPRAAA